MSLRPPRRLLRAAAPLACAVLVVAGLSLDPGHDRLATASRTPTGVGSCVRTGPLDDVDELDRFVDSTSGQPGFLGADIGVDVQLDGGRSLWFFGDTLRSAALGAPFVRNSVLMFTPGCVRLLQAPRGGAVIPDRDDGTGYWPMSAWRLDLDGVVTVDVMLQRVASEPGRGLGFVTLGPALAVFVVGRDSVPRLVSRVDLGPDDESQEAPAWGAASAQADGWVYLYGTSTRSIPGVHGFALRVARVRPGLVSDLASWRYWNGRAWVADPSSARALIGEEGGVSQTLSVWRQDGHWYVLSKEDEFLGRHIAVWTGYSPAGPFGPAQAVADLPCDPETGELRYMPLAHPGLLPRPGTVVVSYSRNFVDLGQVCAAPTRYRPYFLRVSLPAR